MIKNCHPTEEELDPSHFNSGDNNHRESHVEERESQGEERESQGEGREVKADDIDTMR